MTNPAEYPFEVVVDHVASLVKREESPASACAALEALVTQQRTWSDRMIIERAARQLLVIEMFKVRCRA
ncbi:MAG TPA: hypothetical protein PLU72_18390 [Candidatus Ozemobacteraceae bacterium]|nr:hypothetical protein [Candidatus Ozemobacteraceae bacterium]